MMNAISQGLLITLIGMGLVFLAIVLLWGLMSLMVRLDGSRMTNGSGPQESSPIHDPADTPVSAGEKKRKAAAAAVAFALAERNRKRSMEQGAGVSPISVWQPAQRAQALQNKANIFTGRSTRR